LVIEETGSTSPLVPTSCLLAQQASIPKQNHREAESSTAKHSQIRHNLKTPCSELVVNSRHLGKILWLVSRQLVTLTNIPPF